MDRKTILVTGGSRGIGLGMARKLAEQGHELILVARDVTRLENACEALSRRTGNSSIHPLTADLSVITETEQLAISVVDRWPRLDAVILNHAAIFPERRLTSDGLERNFALNFLSYALLMQALLPAVRSAKHGRIVNIVAEAHRRTTLDLADLQSEKGYNSVDAYCRAKLAVILFAQTLAGEPAASGVDILCSHPGSMYTDALRDMRNEFTRLTGSTDFPQAEEVETGVAPLVRLVTDPAFNGMTGGYFIRDEKAEPSEDALDSTLARALHNRISRYLPPPSVPAGAK